MSIQIVGWVLEDCPDLPKHLVATMIGLANHADRDGKGAYPSQETLAWYTRKDERSVRRDLDQLEELKLIRKGDQRMVLHLPPDKRTIVWDLAVERKRAPRPEPGSPGRPRKEKETEGTSASTGNSRGDVDVKNGGTPTAKRQDADVPRTVLEPSVEPSIEPSVPSERPPTADEAIQPTLNGEVVTRSERDITNIAMGIARGWVAKWEERQPDGTQLKILMDRRKGSPQHAVASAIRFAVRENVSDVDIKRAMAWVNMDIPEASQLRRGLVQVQLGWKPAKDWRPGQPHSNGLYVNGANGKTGQQRNGQANGNRNTGPMAGSNLFIADITPEQRDAQNPFKNAVRSSDVWKEATG